MLDFHHIWPRFATTTFVLPNLGMLKTCFDNTVFKTFIVDKKFFETMLESISSHNMNEN